MTYQYKFMCGYECCISVKIMHSYLLTWRKSCLKRLKDRSHNAQNRMYGEISSRIFETYKNAVRPHSFHIYIADADMAMVEIYPFNSEHHRLTH